MRLKHQCMLPWRRRQPPQPVHSQQRRRLGWQHRPQEKPRGLERLPLRRQVHCPLALLRQSLQRSKRPDGRVRWRRLSATAAGAWNELWLLASQVDYLLAACTSEAEILAALNSSDQAELALRRIASWQYVQRTGDQSGGDRILGSVAPGRLVDVAPAWMITDATLHSKMEHQRASRVREQQGGGGQLNQRQNRPPPTTPAAAGESRGSGRGGGGTGGRGRGRGRGRN